MRDDHDETPAAVCRIGDHKHPGDSRICDRHLQQMRAELADVARYTRQLTDHLVPGSGAEPAGEKVSTSRVGSPTPARLDVLNAIGPGGRDVRRTARTLHVLVRRWSTRTPYQVETVGPDGKPVFETRHVTGWHSQLLTDGKPQPSTCGCGHTHDDDTIPTGTPIGRPVLVLDDDQVGTIPPAEWADEWVRRLRLALGRTRSPLRAQVDLACDADQRRRVERARIGESLRTARRTPALMPAVARLIAVQRLYEQHLQHTGQRVALALLGVRDDGPAHQQRVADAMAGRALGATRLQHDSVTAEWAVRYGSAHTAAAVEIDTRRLADWLELAADSDVDLPELATELRSLHAQLAHIVGEISDEQWLGRCPARLRDPDGEETDRVCGTGLWQDPYRTSIECPRCRSRWQQKDWLGLAALIRTQWPIDRRRRYTQADKAAAEKSDRLPHCSGCRRAMQIEWRDATGRRDRTRFWTPGNLTCPAGCLTGTVMVAAA